MADQPTTAVTPGYKTTEFYLSLASTILGFLFASGVVTDTSSVGKILGLGASVLGALGYTVARSIVKSNS